VTRCPQIAAGAIDAILDAMRANPTDADIQLACLTALAAMARNEKAAKLMADKVF